MATQIFKANGLKVKKVYGNFNNNWSGRTNTIAKGLFNAAGQVFALEGKPYFPIGGAAAFKAIVEDGLNQPAYGFVTLPNTLTVN